VRKIFFKTLAALAASAGAVILASASASAATVTFASTLNVSDDINNPNIGYASSGLNSTLTVGVPFTISDFIVAGVNGASFTSQTGNISAVFSFTGPPGASGGTDSGSIAASVVQTDNHIGITWSDPITVTFTDGTNLLIDLANVDYDCGSGAHACNQKNIDIAGTFTTVENGRSNALGETPLPAAFPLFASGVGALGLLGRRRKRKAALAAA